MKEQPLAHLYILHCMTIATKAPCLLCGWNNDNYLTFSGSSMIMIIFQICLASLFSCFYFLGSVSREIHLPIPWLGQFTNHLRFLLKVYTRESIMTVSSFQFSTYQLMFSTMFPISFLKWNVAPWPIFFVCILYWRIAV